MFYWFLWIPCRETRASQCAAASALWEKLRNTPLSSRSSWGSQWILQLQTHLLGSSSLEHVQVAKCVSLLPQPLTSYSKSPLLAG